MSASAFLNSFSPSSPIFRPKLSAIRGHLLQNGIKKARISPGKRKEPMTRLFPKLDSVSLHFSELGVNIPPAVHDSEHRDGFYLVVWM